MIIAVAVIGGQIDEMMILVATGYGPAVYIHQCFRVAEVPVVNLPDIQKERHRTMISPLTRNPKPTSHGETRVPIAPISLGLDQLPGAVVNVGINPPRFTRIGMLGVSEGADAFSPTVQQWLDKSQAFLNFCKCQTPFMLHFYLLNPTLKSFIATF